jgi:type IV pilus assembly protein PilE
MRVANLQSSRGFTLVEVMIVVAIIGTLSTVALMSYDSYIKKGQRAGAQQLMLNIASRQQQYMLDARNYSATIGSGGLGVTSDGWSCAASTCSNARYSVVVAVAAGSPPTFTITGTALGAQAGDGTLTLNNLGQKTRMVGGTDKGW